MSESEGFLSIEIVGSMLAGCEEGLVQWLRICVSPRPNRCVNRVIQEQGRMAPFQFSVCFSIYFHVCICFSFLSHLKFFSFSFFVFWALSVLYLLCGSPTIEFTQRRDQNQRLFFFLTVFALPCFLPSCFPTCLPFSSFSALSFLFSCFLFFSSFHLFVSLL